jgi:hypothetical protein
LKNSAVLCGNPFSHVLEIDSEKGQENSQEFSQVKAIAHQHRMNAVAIFAQQDL